MRGFLSLLAIGFLLSLVNLSAPAQQQPGEPAKGGQEKKTRVDAYGDTLPDGAVARLGARKWRHDGEVAAAIWSPDGKNVASTASDDAVYLWDASTGRTLWRTAIGPKKVSANHLNLLAFSPDGRSLIVAREIGGVKLLNPQYKPQMILLDSATGKITGEFKGLSNYALAVTFGEKGKSVLSLDETGLVQWWDVAALKEAKRWQAAEIVVESTTSVLAHTATWSSTGDKFALRTISGRAGAVDRRSIYSVVDVTLKKTLWKSERDPTSVMTPLQFSPDGKLLALGGNELPAGVKAQQPPAKAGVVVCDILTGKDQIRFDAVPRVLTFSGDGRTIATADLNSTWIYDTKSGKLLRTLKIANRMAGTRLTGGRSTYELLSQEGKRLLIADENSLAIHDAENGDRISGPEGHLGAVRWLRFGNDGKSLDSWSNGKDLISWTLADSRINRLSHGSGLAEVEGKKLLPFNQIITRDHTYVLTSRFDDNSIDVREHATGKVLSTLALPLKESAELRFGPVIFSPTHKYVAIVEKASTSWHVFETENGRYASRLDLGGPSPRLGINLEWRIVFSQNDKFMAVADLDGKISIHELGTEKGSIRLEGVDRKWLQGNGAMDFSADAKLLVAWGERDGPIRVWDLATGKVIHQIALKDKQLPKPAFADPLAGLSTLGGAGGPPFALSPDNRMLAAALGEDRKIIQVWELSTAKTRHAFKGHKGDVSALAWSPDGRLLASGGEDTTVLIWNTWEAEGKK